MLKVVKSAITLCGWTWRCCACSVTHGLELHLPCTSRQTWRVGGSSRRGPKRSSATRSHARGSVASSRMSPCSSSAGCTRQLAILKACRRRAKAHTSRITTAVTKAEREGNDDSGQACIRKTPLASSRSAPMLSCGSMLSEMAYAPFSGLETSRGILGRSTCLPSGSRKRTARRQPPAQEEDPWPASQPHWYPRPATGAP